MCGFGGFYSTNLKVKQEKVLFDMGEAIKSRGPDGAGTWISNDKNIGMVHRRLAIIDLSPAGHQPMFSPSGRYTIVYNGEIYNYKKIKEVLSSSHSNFNGTSDTEVLLHALEEYGVKKTLSLINGMFAFALWDNKEKKLWLARDRMGIKPLVYGWYKGNFLFASELSAIKCFPGFCQKISKSALYNYFKYNYVPAPYTIFEDFYKLLPGHYLCIDFSNNKKMINESYWQLSQIYKEAQKNPFKENITEAEVTFDKILKEAISERMVSDVPLGALLSGGIDSTLITAITQEKSSKPVNTFTIGFDNKVYNEAPFAKEIANLLGTNHTEMYISSDDVLNLAPKISETFDEPFADSSQIPTYLVSQLTRKHVTVCLSGDGGDELFSGYKRYQLARDIRKFSKYIPPYLRQTQRNLIDKTSTNLLNNLFSPLRSLSKRYTSGENAGMGDKMKKFSHYVAYNSPLELYENVISCWQDIHNPAKEFKQVHHTMLDFSLGNFCENMMLHDGLYYIPDNSLVKVDRTSMANSLEMRVPLLDQKVIKFSYSLPLEYKTGEANDNSKLLMKRLLYKYVPKQLLDRPKKGFSVPMRQWIREDLNDWVSELINKKSLSQHNYLDSSEIMNVYKEHMSGERNWQSQLWAVIIFQSWYQNNKEYIKD